jgi:RHS repeat-associated protein
MAQQTVLSRVPDSREVGTSRSHWHRESYVRHRDYSPRLGRFIQRDPLGFEAGDNNWYRFVGNAPTGKLDPTGEIVWVPVIIGIGLGYWWTTNPANAPGPNDPVYPPDETGFVEGVVVGAGLGWRPGSAAAGRCPAARGGAALAERAAAAGARYPKQVEQALRMTPQQLQNSVKSFTENIAKHQGYIKNPLSKVPNWNQLSPQHQQNLINHWNNDIARAQAYRAIAEGVLGGACK